MKNKLISILLKIVLPIVLVYYLIRYLLATKKEVSSDGDANVATGNVSKEEDYSNTNTNKQITLPILFDDVSTPFQLPSFRNLARTLAPQTGNLDIAHFGTVNARYYEDETGYPRPVWGVYWDLEQYPFGEKKPWECGFSGSTNLDTAKDGVDYLHTEEELATYPTFTSAIPFQYRTHSQYGAGAVEPWLTGTDEEMFELGRGVGQSNAFGGGDNILDLTKRQIVVADVESGAENGSRKHRLFSFGVLSRTFGYFSSMYSGLFLELGYTEDQGTGAKKYYNYPDANGDYSPLVNINEDWKPATTTTVPSMDLVGLRLTDYKRALPCNEQSFYFEEMAAQGSNYVLNEAGDYILVNKFGPNKTVRHPMSLLVTALQWQSYYCYYKLGKHRNMFMPKMVCDRGNLGKNQFSRSSTGALIADTLASHTNQNVGRKYAFLFMIALFMNDVDGWLWDRAVELNLGGIDTYGGATAAVEMLESVGAIEHHRSLVPEFWFTEYSLDNGVTWKRSYAIDWDTSTTDVLGVLIKKSGSKVLLVAFRPEGVEPLSFIARTQIGYRMKYFSVGVNDWESVEYADKDLDLDEIPDANKSIYCQMFDVE